MAVAVDVPVPAIPAELVEGAGLLVPVPVADAVELVKGAALFILVLNPVAVVAELPDGAGFLTVFFGFTACGGGPLNLAIPSPFRRNVFFFGPLGEGA
jgi:predicted membrane chloride channel (bestrophin family)